MEEIKQYDVIVVGGGHAGSEASLAAARMGMKTLLVTLNLDIIGFMPCNPSIGGPAKGVVVREIDALGGEMGRNIDKTYVQMRMLNTGKGPAVRALRAQADKFAYQTELKKTLEQTENLDLKQGIVEKLIVEDDVVKGVEISTGTKYFSKSVIITAGTALRGEIIIGELKYSSGPNNSLPSIGLANHLKELGLEIDRFKTGTPPRVKSSSINYDVTEIQPGDTTPNHFSFETKDEAYKTDQLPCWLTYTNLETHGVIRENLHRAPMFTGIVEGVGARYCPSIEDKVVRFSDKPRHQIFLEPEGANTDEVYVQGLSTSLPEDVQQNMVRSIEGLEQAEIMRSGYAIEYDVVVPHQLRPTLETMKISGLYTAGQTNGTSGYEEAACQGLMAGINAALKIQEKEPLVLKRSDAYIGVLIDDLVTKGTNEPYRLLTSRAEYRLLLRHDNADLRLTEMGQGIGLVNEERYEEYQTKKEMIEEEMKRLEKSRLKPTKELQEFLATKNSAALKDGILAVDLLKRPELSYLDVVQFIEIPEVEIPRYVYEQVEIQVKYEGYIKKANDKVAKLKRMEAKKIPANIDYTKVNSLATEAIQKLEKIRPETIAQASRISGVNPSDISILMVYIEQGKIAKKDSGEA
ncbi:tRNA uridine-5-carboxymethylaminomethyl(34) synthesis enzyme MnmG [Vagococcus carniphilus]|uniref:tRNA uridine 5-carboxymethylaminomethyl modification enzyme MnmG n=1 Tax=Vagococcus carniphilus TaxID=218144 RepID=A0AAW8U692_9ENTE|nr:tRNA uridine-5-carboxymethylaminomethyl(34) synthesis enzyme MnmG [Vagococcus carniphilus]MDT2815914.1 tRNA uridine-5-carboxymethylaminomethyl(34) synthesis enzyme MnmG [Vagococcus carniphilus]MDT2831380.1 tRNA uridine-5-carboxymethylaminomethyl(34) synthesis enzyme MnmG [Vagococcus carniphilus]MDT2832847.1 tRNA uridine-5-carboxymethylaminomethyl(34) synthesis enzyme MnmG [Vagococcus carniphilus]MDT2840286.1 tRNA uridine-5-carboxymethylaminomethyl(34) synthesis enzyme MnmG [Vagococcus carnip